MLVHGSIYRLCLAVNTTECLSRLVSVRPSTVLHFSLLVSPSSLPLEVEVSVDFFTANEGLLYRPCRQLKSPSKYRALHREPFGTLAGVDWRQRRPWIELSEIKMA